MQFELLPLWDAIFKPNQVIDLLHINLNVCFF